MQFDDGDSALIERERYSDSMKDSSANVRSSKTPLFSREDLDPSANLRWYRRVLRSRSMPYYISPAVLFVSLILLSYLYFDGSESSMITELISQLVKNSVVFCLIAMGSGLVLSTGQLDLSSIGVATFSGVIFSLCLSNGKGSTISSIAIASCASIAFAFLSGSFVTFCFRRLKAPLLILTWAIGSIYTIVAIVAAGSIGVTSQHDVSGVSLPWAVSADFWQIGKFGFSLSLVLTVLVLLFSAWTNLVNRAKAVGANQSSAEYAGVPIKRTYYEVFLANALLSAVAGIMNCMFLGRASTSDLQGKDLIPIAIAVLGGTSLAGGYLALPSIIAAAIFWAAMRMLGPQLPSLFPWLSAFQAELGQVLFFAVFLVVSLAFGKLLHPPLLKVYAKQEG